MKELFKTENYLEPMLLLDYKIDANCNTVYDAWTDLEVFKKWFCPTGFSVALAEMDLKVGGYFRVHMKSPEGEIYPTKGEYLLLDKPNRLVYKDSWDDNRENNEPTVVEIVFEPLGNKTLIKIYSSFATEKQKKNVLSSGIVDGWKMFFKNLNTVLKE
ncbi:SRPBCC domain-containing protein [Flavobacterium sp. K5-23]|uniref:SRPBCC family protein n=1 Tax=Flavobacterium sp. K5-23 TaxID=2746225 RepID=UPI00200FD4DC|nr:SRPBCC domain-containing protein [Flavobacterium sp. K5-23]UQD55139.1 SRPBCC domain-containing protein [Flavobacterium sp. K5-23]